MLSRSKSALCRQTVHVRGAGLPLWCLALLGAAVSFVSDGACASPSTFTDDAQVIYADSSSRDTARKVYRDTLYDMERQYRSERDALDRQYRQSLQELEQRYRQKREQHEREYREQQK